LTSSNLGQVTTAAAAVAAAAAGAAADESEPPAAVEVATPPPQQQQQQVPMATVPPLSSTATSLQKTAARAALAALAQSHPHNTHNILSSLLPSSGNPNPLNPSQIQMHSPQQPMQNYPVRPGFPQVGVDIQLMGIRNTYYDVLLKQL